MLCQICRIHIPLCGLLQVTSPGGNTVHTLKGTSGDKFAFKAPRGGMYKFCFHNSYSTPETVSFYIHVGHIPNEHDLAKDGLCQYKLGSYICGCIGCYKIICCYLVMPSTKLTFHLYNFFIQFATVT